MAALEIADAEIGMDHATRVAQRQLLERRWASSLTALWDADAELLCRLEQLLAARDVAGVAAFMIERHEMGLGVCALAGLALDELLLRGEEAGRG